jgi:hypothetical protein
MAKSQRRQAAARAHAQTCQAGDDSPAVFHNTVWPVSRLSADSWQELNSKEPMGQPTYKSKKM